MMRNPPDNLGQLGAETLKRNLEAYWNGLSSASAVSFWIERHGGEHQAPDKRAFWCVRSTLVRGRPGPLLTQASTSITTKG
jgi:hypothetical protein